MFRRRLPQSKLVTIILCTYTLAPDSIYVLYSHHNFTGFSITAPLVLQLKEGKPEAIIYPTLSKNEQVLCRETLADKYVGELVKETIKPNQGR